MFSFLVFDSVHNLPSSSETLLQELRLANIFFRISSHITLTDLEQLCTSRKLSTHDFLIITDNPDFAVSAKRAGYICFGYTEWNPSLRFPSIPLILEGLEEVTLSFLQREFAHAGQEPALICETKRCRIQELTMDDIPQLYYMLQQACQPNPDLPSQTIIPFLRKPLGTLQDELEKHAAYIKHVYPLLPYGIWGIFQKDTGHLMGRLGITETILQGNAEYELEYFLHTDYRGKGYAAECVNAVLNYAKEQETESICVCIHNTNEASLRVLKHCGFPWQTIPSEQAAIQLFRIYLHHQV